MFFEVRRYINISSRRLPANVHLGQEDRDDGEEIRDPRGTGQTSDHRLAGGVPGSIHRRDAQVFPAGARQVDWTQPWSRRYLERGERGLGA